MPSYVTERCVWKPFGNMLSGSRVLNPNVALPLLHGISFRGSLSPSTGCLLFMTLLAGPWLGCSPRYLSVTGAGAAACAATAAHWPCAFAAGSSVADGAAEPPVAVSSAVGADCFCSPSSERERLRKLVVNRPTAQSINKTSLVRCFPPSCVCSMLAFKILLDLQQGGWIVRRNFAH